MVIKTQIQKTYEVLIVLKSNLSEEDIETNITQVESAIRNYGGSLIKVHDPFRKSFTHKIKGFRDGYYISILFSSLPDVPNTLKRTLSISDDVLRYMVLKKEEDREYVK